MIDRLRQDKWTRRVMGFAVVYWALAPLLIVLLNILCVWLPDPFQEIESRLRGYPIIACVLIWVFVALILLGWPYPSAWFIHKLGLVHRAHLKRWWEQDYSSTSGLLATAAFGFPAMFLGLVSLIGPFDELPEMMRSGGTSLALGSEIDTSSAEESKQSSCMSPKPRKYSVLIDISQSFVSDPKKGRFPQVVKILKTIFAGDKALANPGRIEVFAFAETVTKIKEYDAKNAREFQIFLNRAEVEIMKDLKEPFSGNQSAKSLTHLLEALGFILRSKEENETVILFSDLTESTKNGALHHRLQEIKSLVHKLQEKLLIVFQASSGIMDPQDVDISRYWELADPDQIRRINMHELEDLFPGEFNTRIALNLFPDKKLSRPFYIKHSTERTPVSEISIPECLSQKSVYIEIVGLSHSSPPARLTIGSGEKAATILSSDKTLRQHEWQVSNGSNRISLKSAIPGIRRDGYRMHIASSITRTRYVLDVIFVRELKATMVWIVVSMMIFVSLSLCVMAFRLWFLVTSSLRLNLGPSEVWRIVISRYISTEGYSRKLFSKKLQDLANKKRRMDAGDEAVGQVVGTSIPEESAWSFDTDIVAKFIQGIDISFEAPKDVYDDVARLALEVLNEPRRPETISNGKGSASEEQLGSEVPPSRTRGESEQRGEASRKDNSNSGAKAPSSEPSLPGQSPPPSEPIVPPAHPDPIPAVETSNEPSAEKKVSLKRSTPKKSV